MNKQTKSKITYFLEGAISVLVLVALVLYAKKTFTELSYMPTPVSSYETVQDLPAFSISENQSVSPEQTLPPVIRLHAPKNTLLNKIRGIFNMQKKDESEFFCTAFVISDKYAVTAGHCLDNGETMNTGDIEVHTAYIKEDGRSGFHFSGVVAHAAGINRRGDTGVILGDFTAFRKLLFTPIPSEVLSIIGNNLNMLDGSMAAIGFPYGDTPTIVPVKVLGSSGFQIAGVAVLLPGMSGGPLVDPLTGAVVGVNSAVTDGGVCKFSTVVGLLESLGIPVAD